MRQHGVEVGSAQIRFSQGCPVERSLDKSSLREIGFGEVGSAQLRFSQDRSVEHGLDEGSSKEIGFGEIGTAQVCLFEARLAEIGSTLSMPCPPRIPGMRAFLEKFEMVSICQGVTSSSAGHSQYMITGENSQGRVGDGILPAASLRAKVPSMLHYCCAIRSEP